MAVYKVAQDVEAEDKLLGPFSFRQFIYLIIMVMGGIMAWGLGSLFFPLAIIPLPIVVLFGALALPLKKDQPMETYLGALVSFYIKPRKRLWEPDGIEHMIEITVPKTDDVQRTKDLSRTEAQRRLAYLADLADTRGWSIRHSTMPNEQAVAAMVPDVYNEAQQTQDMLDDGGDVAQIFDNMIGKADQQRRQEAMDRMRAPTTPQAAPPAMQPQVNQPDATISQPVGSPLQATPLSDDDTQQLRYDPYPNMRQSMISPTSEAPVPRPTTSQPSQPAQPTQPTQPAQPTPTVAQPQPVQVNQAQPEPQNQVASTSVTPPSADILELANNTDLSIETIAHEAQRRSKKTADDEVVISLR